MRFHTTGSKPGRFLVSAFLCLTVASPSAFCRGRDPGFQLPANEKLDLETALAPQFDQLGAGSSDDESSKKKKKKEKKPRKRKKGEEEVASEEETNVVASASPSSFSLAPLTLNGESNGQQQQARGQQGQPKAPDGTLNASITTTTFIPKGPLSGNDNLLAPTSVKGSKAEKFKGMGGKLSDQAQSVNAAPLPLVDSMSESEGKMDLQRELERKQLTNLWESTLARSPDINFVLQKLMPASDHAKVTTFMMRTLSTAMMGGMMALGTVAPGVGGQLGQGIGMSTMGQLLSLQDSKNAKKARLSETECIMLFKMIRQTADHLVESYRNYKGQHTHVYKANSDFEDLKAMVKDAGGDKSAAEQVEMNYTLRKAERELDKEGASLNKFRQQLVDLAGADAVVKLDKDIDDEFKKLHPELFIRPGDAQGATGLAGRDNMQQQL